MKFCHVLESSSVQVPEYRTLFVFYKRMKKQINRWPRGGPPLGVEDTEVEEGRFVEALLLQIDTLDSFRLERQSASVRSLGELQANLSSNRDEKQHTYHALVNFHGEAILLLHWIILAYTAIVKLLKKHNRRTGLLVQSPRLRELLSQSSWSTETVTELIRQAEACINQLHTEIFDGYGSTDNEAGEVAGPDRGGHDNHELFDRLASLTEQHQQASGEESSAGLQNETADEDEDERDASVGSCAYDPTAAASAPHDGSGDSTAARGEARDDSQLGASHPEPGNCAADAEPFVNHALVQHMEDALRTWQYLGTHASTPSTVVRKP